jgi:hypothetical protein
MDVSRAGRATFLGALSLVGGLLLAACHRTPRPDSSVTLFVPSTGCTTRALPPERMSDTLSVTAALRQREMALVYAARHLPGGFTAGPLGTAGRTTLLFLRDPTQGSALIAQLPTSPGLANLRPLLAAPVELRPTEWDRAELHDWMHYITSRLDPNSLRGWGITVTHRLSFGVFDREGLPKLQAQLERLGVPCRLVEILVFGPIHIA